MILYVLCGIQGSGKTTLAKIIGSEYGAIRHSYDEIPNSRKNPDKDGKIWDSWIDGMKTDLKNGEDVVCDSTNLTKSSRIRLLREFIHIPCRKILIVVNTPVEECLSRNAKREEKVPAMEILFASRIFEKPAKTEKWDEIYFYNYKQKRKTGDNYE